MKQASIIFLGTGTSSGIPVIGCNCKVCRSKNLKNKRKRASIYVSSDNINILIDTPPDFREQALAYNVKHIDVILFTHNHADHIFGLDDIRRFNEMQKAPIPCFASKQTVAAIRRIFPHTQIKPPEGVSYPELKLKTISQPICFKNAKIIPISVIHSLQHTIGFRIDINGCGIGYVPDCKILPESSIKKLRGLDVMILDALRPHPHPTHLTLDESISLLKIIGAKHSFITHLSHYLDHDKTQKTMPKNFFVPFDGLKINI
jgi:phosphoribosyl 1,2-cyclic phosphate phosphodiesterase